MEFSLDRGNNEYAGWTVFTGDNGAGKSTLLKAIAIGLKGKDVGRVLQGSFNRWIAEGEKTGSIELILVRTKGDDTSVTAGATGAIKFPAKLSFSLGERETSLESVLPPNKPASYKTPDRTIWTPESTGWFSCGYGPFRRVFGASPEATRSMVSSLTESYVTMFQEAASLAEVDTWMRELKHKSLEGKKEEAAQLDLLLRILSDDLLPNQMTINRVDSDGLWLKDAVGLELAWSEMSDGYRAALALLADILRHLINAYGIEGLTDVNSEGRTFIKRSGVVLIDEIDAHLHPEWQQKMGFWLTSHFPNIQFIVTTHSPMILQAAGRNGIFHLPAPGSGEEAYALSVQDYEKIIASRPDTILLTPAFGLTNTRSPFAVDSRAEYSKIKSKQKAGAELTSEESKKLVQLQLFVSNDEEL